MKKLNYFGFLGFVLILTLSACTKTNENKIDLAGTWRFATDPSDKGIPENRLDKTFTDSLKLPGSMTSNGKGDAITLSTPWTGQIVDSSFYKNPEYARYREPGKLKIPFWLQPLTYYKGAAWYQKEIIIPKEWSRQSIELFLERCHWESRLWVEDSLIGMQNSLGTPHRYDLTGILTPGKHVLTLCVDNRVKDIDPGLNSHSISDHTQTNWNGIIGKLFLEAKPLVNISNVQIYPDIKSNKFKAKLKVNNRSGLPVKVKLKLAVFGAGTPESQSHNFILATGENILTMEYPMEQEVKYWSEFHPEIYTLTATLTRQNPETTDTYHTTFGMREFKAVGKQLLINGKPTFMRGTLECAIFPKTGYPATDLKEWLRIFNVCRAHGLNHIRFHSWCPPEAAFEAADLTGFYLHVECSSWANGSTTIGDGKPFDKYLYEESERMVENYGNHPSFCMMVYGNEPAGRNQVPFLTDFVNYWKKKDNRRIYTSGGGWPALPENDYLSSPVPRIQGWGQGLKSIINGEPPRTDYDWSPFTSRFNQPIISHEIGQWCVYPDFKEIAKYDGVMRARNFEIFRETLKAHGMELLADSFLLASGKLQALCYKADIEAALRTKDFGGFQLLDLHDFPGQGSALVGVLNAFWGEKGYISPAEYKRFCNSTVPLARLKKCTFTNNETFEAAVEVAHFGDSPITNCIPKWKVSDKTGKIIQEGQFPSVSIPLGNGFKLGNISFPLSSCLSAEKLKLDVTVENFSNSWDFFVYPAKKEAIAGEQNIRIVQQIDSKVSKFLEDGGVVLLNLKKGTLSNEMGGDIKIGFSSIFWNTAWTHGQPPTTLGILCNPAHPALADFPTQYHSNWQWWHAMSHSGAIDLSNFPSEIRPIVRLIDDWFTNRPLALLFEAKVGKGKILVSGIDLTSELENRPEAQQLLFSLKKYLTGSKFRPEAEVSVDKLMMLTK